MKKKWLQRLFYTTVFLPVALIWGELFTHILLPQNVDTIVDIFQPDSIVGYIYQPNAHSSERGREYDVSYSTNSLGLRDREYELDAKGVFRVLLFGDSFSESHGLNLEKSLPKQIEHFLQRELDSRNLKIKVEVINLSFGGYSPYHYWKSYRRWKSVFNPQLVIIGFYMGNDYICEGENIRYVIEDGEIVGAYNEGETPHVRARNPIRSIRKWLARKSELYVLMRNFFYYNDMVGFFTKKVKAQQSDSQLKPYLVPEPEEVNAQREKCFGYLRRLSDESASDGLPVALITIPRKFEIDRSYLEQVMKTQGISPDTLDLDQPYKKLANFCHSTGIFFFDPRIDMKKNTASSSLYFQYDGHWNAEGVENAAKSTIQQWREQKLPPFK